MMNKEIKQKWIEALRSGEYEQGEGRLKKEGIMKDDKPLYCCLGVLCEVATREGLLEKNAWHPSDEYPPFSFMQGIGLDSENPYLTIGSDVYQVADLNDEGYNTHQMKRSLELNQEDDIPAFTFEVLSDLIDKQL